MFATARFAIAATFAAVLLGSSTSPALAADRVAGTSMPAVDFTIATDGTYVAGVLPSIPASMLADVLAAPAAPQAPLAAPFKAPVAPLEAPSLRRGLYASFAALQVMDFVSTNKALSSGGVEGNAAMAGVVKNKGAFMAVKAGTAVAAAFFAEKLAKNHPRKATILMLVLNGAYAAIVAHNYQVARSNR